MKERLLKFLNSENLSSAKFAEKIGVQPSSISHILSGRNKPGFDFIYKFLTSYPSINAEWLITGAGSMFKGEYVQGELFSVQQNANFKEQYQDNPNTEKDTYDNSVNNEDTDTSVTTESDVHDDISNSGTPDGVTSVNSTKSIDKIVIFFSDKSFREYSPE